VPCYALPESAIRALARAAQYRAWRARDQGTIARLGGLRQAGAREFAVCFLIQHHDGGWLSPAEVTSLLACYGIPVVTTRPVISEGAAVEAAASLGRRVVVKADVPGLVHKSGAGGVQLDLHGEQEVRRAYQALAAEFGTSLRQILVQLMISGGVEVLIGVAQEPVFGPLIVFGPGGVATGLLGGHTARLTPSPAPAQPK